MLSHIATDLHKSYVEEVFKPQLGKPGAAEPEKPTSSSDLDGDGKTDSFERKVRQFVYDVRHLMRKNNIPVERAFQIRSSKTNYGAEVIKTAKEKLGIKSGGSAPVSEEKEGGEKLFSIVINYRNGTTYRKRTTRSEISRLRSNPNVSSVEMTKYGVDGLAKKDYDGDGKIESGSKEHAGAVHNAIQRKLGGTPDGQDTRGKAPKKKLKGYGVSEGFSNWRQDLNEVIGVDDEIASRNKKQIKERNVDNYGGGKNAVVKINPEIATEEIDILGGRIVEAFELDESYLNEAVNIASDFFYNCELNENGIDIVVEELGENVFAEFVFELAEQYNLSEARRSGRIEPVSKSGKSISTLKGGAKASAIRAKQKEKAARNQSDDRPSGMTAALKSQSEVAKKIRVDKVKKATEKAKEVQAPSDKPRKKSIQDRVAGFILRGIERDKKARETASKLAGQTAQTLKKAASVGSKAASEFGKGVASGVKATTKVAKDTHKVLKNSYDMEEELHPNIQKIDAINKERVAKRAKKAEEERQRAKESAVQFQAFKKKHIEGGGTPVSALDAWQKRKLQNAHFEMEGSVLDEKAESEQQQKLFGLALSVKRGQTSRSEASPEVLKIVDGMSEKKIRDFAKTPHSEVPKKKIIEAISNPEGVTDTESPLITRIQKKIANKQVKNAQERLGEDIASLETSDPKIADINKRISSLEVMYSKKNDPNTKRKILALNLQKQRLEAQEARKKVKNINPAGSKEQTPQIQNSSYQLDGELVDEQVPTRLFYKLQAKGKGGSKTALAQTKISADLERQKGEKMRRQQTIQRQEREPEEDHPSLSARERNPNLR